MKKSSSTLVNGGLVPEKIGFDFFFEKLEKTGKKSVIVSKTLIYRFPDGTNLLSYVPKGLTNSLSYCGSFKDKYICRYGCACMVMSRLPVQATVQVCEIKLRNEIKLRHRRGCNRTATRFWVGKNIARSIRTSI